MDRCEHLRCFCVSEHAAGAAFHMSLAFSDGRSPLSASVHILIISSPFFRACLSLSWSSLHSSLWLENLSYNIRLIIEYFSSKVFFPQILDLPFMFVNLWGLCRVGVQLPHEMALLNERGTPLTSMAWCVWKPELTGTILCTFPWRFGCLRTCWF